MIAYDAFGGSARRMNRFAGQPTNSRTVLRAGVISSMPVGTATFGNMVSYLMQGPSAPGSKTQRLIRAEEPGSRGLA